MKIGALVLIFFSCVAFVLSAYNIFQVFTHPLKFKKDIIACAEEFDLTPELIASVINVESSFKENSRSNKNAIGLMQVKLTTANYLNDLNKQTHITENELFVTKTNIKYGSQYLRYLINKFDSVDTALAAYNAGETIVRSWLNSNYSFDGKTLNYIPYLETNKYVQKVNKNIKYYKNIFNN